MKKRLNLKTAYKGRLISLFLEKHKFPNGNVVDLEIVRHPGAVLIVPFLNEEKIILIRQYRPVINSYIWELPAGTLKKGENPLTCAKRELVEEVGYSPKVIKKIGYIYPAPGYTTEKIIIFKANKLIKAKAYQYEHDEVITPEIFTKKQIKDLVNKRKIVDAKTICALAICRII